MTLHIAEYAGRTDVGRQRSANEDSLVLAPPFFAVADGMGGAKAGEVASSTAAKVFDEKPDASAPPEAQLTAIAQEANRRIHELGVADESRRGMGTTLTMAKVHGCEVSLGHVGDSRAYLLRDGEIEQLTRDHSLVAELERSGQISAEAAEHHPQRSVITRALGPEPSVEVDTFTLTGREGDLFLICSDGLTTMISDSDVASILRRAGSLEEAAESLVLAANQSGGKDNITVVLFRLSEEEAEEEAGVPGDEDTITGGIHADDVRAAAGTATRRPERTDERRLDARRPDATEVGAPAVRPPLTSPLQPASTRRRRRGLRSLAKLVLALLLIGGLLGGLYALSRQVYFLGTNDAGLVSLYRGVPYELPLGIELYSEEYPSGVPARAIPKRRRDAVLDHEWRSRGDAVDLLRTLEQGRLAE
jgi:protein phosphatase